MLQHFPNGTPLLKIGYSRDIPERMKSLRDKCSLFDLTRVHDFQDRSIRSYWKVEKLVDTELSNFQRTLKCNNSKCKTEHREWFAVSEEVALRTVQRWRKFIEHEPYDENGILKDHWSKMIGINRMNHPNGEEQWSHSETRDDRWTRWLQRGINEGPEKV